MGACRWREDEGGSEREIQSAELEKNERGGSLLRFLEGGHHLRRKPRQRLGDTKEPATYLEDVELGDRGTACARAPMSGRSLEISRS